MIASLSVHRILTSLLLLMGWFSVCDAQTATLKKVENVTDIIEGKYYVLAATVDGNMYAMQALERGKKSDCQFYVENITVNPSLLDDDNLFSFSAGDKDSGYKQRKFYSKARGQVHNDGDSKITIDYRNVKVEDFFIDRRDGQDGLQLHMGKSTNRPVAMGEACEYCKGYNDTGSGKYPMFIYEYVELPSTPSQVQVGTVEIKTSEGYATYFNSKSFILPDGLKAAIVSEADRGKYELTLDWMYSAGDVVPGATGLLLYGAQGEYALFAPPSDEGNAPSAAPFSLSSDTPKNNLLLGSDEDAQTVGAEAGVDYMFYKLSYLTDVDTQEKVLGFYWGATSGIHFMNKANHAYLALRRSVGSEIKGFHLPSFSDVAGMKSVPVSSQPASDNGSIFTLDGRFVGGKGWKELPAGVYVRNGRKMVKR